MLQLRWDHQAQFAGYYAALWQGYYADAGLEVEIRSAFSPDGRVQPVPEVLDGRADFGIGAADVLVAIDGGAPLLIVLPVFQQSVFGVVATKEAEVSSLADLVGLRVKIPGSLTSVAELDAMLAAEGIDPDTIDWVEVGPAEHAQALADGAFDTYFTPWRAARWSLAKLGVESTILRPATYGVDFYGDALFTRSELLDRDPILVRKFIDATRAGWEYAWTITKKLQTASPPNLFEPSPKPIFPNTTKWSRRNWAG